MIERRNNTRSDHRMEVLQVKTVSQSVSKVVSLPVQAFTLLSRLSFQCVGLIVSLRGEPLSRRWRP